MTTMTGLSSVASLSLGLSMSMSSHNQPGVSERTAKLQSQLSMIASPSANTHTSQKQRRRASLGTPADRVGGRSPSPRLTVTRQEALCPSPISELPPATLSTAAPTIVPTADDEQHQELDAPCTDAASGTDAAVTVMSF